jgi:transglutaminase-like putative cysteine protease
MLDRLKTLPREARDTLFLLVVIAWIIAPQVGNLPIWCSAMAALVLLWRGFVALRNLALPSRWLRLGLLALAIGATLYTYRTLFGRDAGVTFIVVLLTLKTLEMRARRDALVIFFLGFFTMLSNFFFSQSLFTAVSMLIALLGLLTALINSHMPVGRPPLMQAAKTAGWMALLGAPIMAILFVLFPRVAPLWGMPADAMSGRSGLSATMQVGNIASLALDDSVAMRIKFNGAPPPQSSLYFRGPVLSSYDGREWRPLRSYLPPRMQLKDAELSVQGEPVSYQVTLEPNNRPWLLTLDATPNKPATSAFNPSITADLQWVADQSISDLIRYRAVSYPTFRHGPTTRVIGLQDYLELPPGFNPRTLQLAVDMRRDPLYARADTPALVDAVMERLRTGGYTYTLEPGVYGRHTADEFWFDRKAGFCEHIASSFVLLMRALDVPARVVTGYQGGEINSVDGFWTVRQSDAHAWAEVWSAGPGWVRVDPTSAVAPGRTGAFQRLTAPRSVFAQAMGTINPQFTLSLRALMEATNNRWNQWILNYSQSRQLNLLRNLGFESPGWEDLSYVLIAIVVIASLIGAAWTLWERHRQDPWLRLYHHATRKLRQAGVPLPANAPPRRMAELLNHHAQTQRVGEADANLIAAWLLRLESWRYQPTTTHPAATLAALKHEFGRLPWPARF